jgi:DNA-binding XRE family transcriptional regulator
LDLHHLTSLEENELADAALLVFASKDVPEDTTPQPRTISRNNPTQRGKDIRRLRLSLGMTQEDVAEAAEFRSFEAYARLENGTGNPLTATLKKLAEILKANLA